MSRSATRRGFPAATQLPEVRRRKTECPGDDGRVHTILKERRGPVAVTLIPRRNLRVPFRYLEVAFREPAFVFVTCVHVPDLPSHQTVRGAVHRVPQRVEPPVLIRPALLPRLGELRELYHNIARLLRQGQRSEPSQSHAAVEVPFVVVLVGEAAQVEVAEPHRDYLRKLVAAIRPLRPVRARGSQTRGGLRFRLHRQERVVKQCPLDERVVVRALHLHVHRLPVARRRADVEEGRRTRGDAEPQGLLQPERERPYLSAALEPQHGVEEVHERVLAPEELLERRVVAGVQVRLPPDDLRDAAVFPASPSPPAFSVISRRHRFSSGYGRRGTAPSSRINVWTGNL